MEEAAGVSAVAAADSSTIAEPLASGAQLGHQK